MKFSEKWLREWVNPKVASKQLAEQLTMAGLEVDSVTDAAAKFSNVVVGYVKERRSHPDADKLSCCIVDVGEAEPLDIVCGAKNVRAGLKVAVAKVGAVLPGDFHIKKAKLRGEPSNGMICAAKELGLTDESEGIMELPEDAPVGMDFREYLQLDDQIIEIELTPNRGDCLSIRGVAREIATINQLAITAPKIAETPDKNNETFNITLEAKNRCSRYVGRKIKNINSRIASPNWLKEKLRRSGIRSIHPVVDVTNFVMLELGQPMHAFDSAKIDGEIRVRLAKRGEPLTLLDDSKVELTENTLVIADKNKPLAIGGVMGGLDSSVTESTTELFLESAFFHPVGVRQDAKRFNLQTDSSYRFERGVDYQLQKEAIERATQLLVEIVGGEPGPIVEAISENDLPRKVQIYLRSKQIPRLLGIDIENAEIARILQSLEFTLKEEAEGWLATAPSFRFDMEQEIDLIEEIARIYGFNNIPYAKATPEMSIEQHSGLALSRARLKQYWVDRGYNEVITYSFIDPADHALLSPNSPAHTLTNPISADLSVMRNSLWPGLVKALQYNLHRQADRVRIFEMGSTFAKSNKEWQQTTKFAALIAGSHLPLQWSAKATDVDFYDLKKDVEGLFQLLNKPEALSFTAAEHPTLHPGQSAAILHKGQVIGYLGALHPKLVQQLDLSKAPLLFEIDILAVSLSRLPKFAAISKFPAVHRDLAFVVEEAILAADLQNHIRKIAGELLQEVQIFDVYQGENIASGKKSIAMGLTFIHPSRTLIDEEINTLIQSVVENLRQTYDATLRA